MYDRNGFQCRHAKMTLWRAAQDIPHLLQSLDEAPEKQELQPPVKKQKV